MGITSFTRTLIDQILNNNKIENVIELGAQNLYDRGQVGGRWPWGSDLYKARGIEYSCIDLSGENGAQAVDLSDPVAVSRKYDMVTDFGTSEHVLGIYNCWRSKWAMCKDGGFILSENPKEGNWPLHGYWYYTEAFYQKLAEHTGSKIIAIGQHPAMGNEKDGWNIYCTLQKGSGTFPDEDTFMQWIVRGDKLSELTAPAPALADKPSAPKTKPAKKKKKPIRKKKK